MIDMHSHIIPTIDDGPQELKETIEMIKEAKQVGFKSIFMTPHYLTHYYEPSIKELENWKGKIEEEKEIIKTGIKLYSGLEIYVSDSIIDNYNKNKLLTLNYSKYMLIELPINASINYFDNIVFFLQSVSIVPILAHPERYIYIQKNPNLIQEYIKRGILIQSNFGSILGLYGKSAKKVLKKMLRKNQVHFLGSDAHKPNSIYPMIPKALKKIEKIIGKEKIKEITILNPMKVIKNKKIYK